jgi:ribonuclease-3
VLGFVVADVLYKRYPDATEGKLSKMRSSIVSRMNFAHFARELKIDRQVLLGKGEENTGGRERESNLSGTFEAVIGAIFIDGGYRKVYKVITMLLKNCLNGDEEIFKDYKTKLQEVAQRKYKKVPKYKVIHEEGPPHDKNFHIEVKLGRKTFGKGVGRNKKQAEQQAAKQGLERMDKLKNTK